MHLKRYFTFDGNTSKEDMYAECAWFAQENEDRYENPSGDYHPISWRVYPNTFNSEEEAEKFLSNLPSYHDGAVKFLEYPTPKKTAKMKTLEERIAKTKALKEKYEKDHDVHNRTSDTVSCDKCGSRFALAYLDGNKCPLCKKDLRANGVIMKIDYYDTRISALEKELKAETKKQAEKAKPKVMWLVKAEVHC